MTLRQLCRRYFIAGARVAAAAGFDAFAVDSAFEREWFREGAELEACLRIDAHDRAADRARDHSPEPGAKKR